MFLCIILLALVLPIAFLRLAVESLSPDDLNEMGIRLYPVQA